ncbi:hypothetical protein GpartN1_g3765.t1 [Galdieria partita]|uniref:Cation/H+ exchanger transmembrane domain-containing protein n=1 Tax=Galdieria partita TaxID=83374 RepID=A0A9C7PXH1_9RHOD|nr:hypothetical protein GpartN1_g3765.t1 [Galdieria partita]
MVNINLYHLEGASVGTCLSPTSTIVVLMSFALGLRWVNLRTIRLPSSVMVSFAAILSAHLAVFFHRLLPQLGLKSVIETVLNIQKSFPEFVLRWAIGFLLFGDSLEVDLRNLGKIKDMVAIMAFFSTILSSAFIGYLCYIVALFFEARLPLATCFLLGAIISPTDPITVMSVLKERTDLVPEFHRVLVMGESLFNDVVGVVLTEGIKTVITENDLEKWNSAILGRLSWTFLRECIAGVLIGLIFGYFVYHLLSCQVEDSILEVGITVAMVGNINLVCYILGASLPLASVTAGLLLGNYGVVFTMSLKTHEGMKWIWNFCTEMLNTLLFILIGFQSLFVSSMTSTKNILHLLTVIPISLFSRSLSVAIPMLFLGFYSNQLRNGFNIASFTRTVQILTWCGLRGAISVALAMSVPEFIEGSSHIYTSTYVLVVFSIFVQGLFCNKMMRFLCASLQHISFFDTVFQHVPQLKPLPQTKEILYSMSPSRRYSEHTSFLSPLTPIEGKQSSTAKLSNTPVKISIESPPSKKSLISNLSTTIVPSISNDTEEATKSLVESSSQQLPSTLSTSNYASSIDEADSCSHSMRLCQDEQEMEYTLKEYSIRNEQKSLKKPVNETTEMYPLLLAFSSHRPKRKQGTYQSTQKLPPKFPH